MAASALDGGHATTSQQSERAAIRGIVFGHAATATARNRATVVVLEEEGNGMGKKSNGDCNKVGNGKRNVDNDHDNNNDRDNNDDQDNSGNVDYNANAAADDDVIEDDDKDNNGDKDNGNDDEDKDSMVAVAAWWRWWRRRR